MTGTPQASALPRNASPTTIATAFASPTALAPSDPVRRQLTGVAIAPALTGRPFARREFRLTRSQCWCRIGSMVGGDTSEEGDSEPWPLGGGIYLQAAPPAPLDDGLAEQLGLHRFAGHEATTLVEHLALAVAG